jgi:hypothetical protein
MSATGDKLPDVELVSVTRAAHLEAAGTASGRERPVAPDAADSATWPDGIATAGYIVSTRKAASKFIDGSIPDDDRPVAVVRLTGSFELNTTSPAGFKNAVPTGNVETFVVDMRTGKIIDFVLDDLAVAEPLPGQVSLFARDKK